MTTDSCFTVNTVPLLVIAGGTSSKKGPVSLLTKAAGDTGSNFIPLLRDEIWLGGMDSNHDNELQRLASYHWTTSQILRSKI